MFLPLALFTAWENPASTSRPCLRGCCPHYLWAGLAEHPPFFALQGEIGGRLRAAPWARAPSCSDQTPLLPALPRAASPSASREQLIKHVRTRSVQGPTVPSRGDFIDLPSGGSDKNRQGVEKRAREAGTGLNSFSFHGRLKPLRPTQGPTQSQRFQRGPGRSCLGAQGTEARGGEGQLCVHARRGESNVRSQRVRLWERGIIRLS